MFEKMVPAIQLKWDFENKHSLPPPKGSASSSAHPSKPRLQTIHHYMNVGGRGGGSALIFDGRIRQPMNVKMISTLIGQSFSLITPSRLDQNI